MDEKLKAVLALTGVLVKKSDLFKRDWKKIFEPYRKTFSETVGKRTTYKLIKLIFFAKYGGVEYAVFPRAQALEDKWLDVKYNIPKPKEALWENDIVLTDNQQVVANYLMENNFSEKSASAGKGQATVIMETGAGKTYLGTTMANLLKVKTLIIVPISTNISDWKNCLKFTTAKVCVLHEEWDPDADVYLTIINSAVSDRFGARKKENRNIGWSKFMKQFGLVIFDEIPCFCSDKRSVIFQRTNTRYVLGLTATPDERLDGYEWIFEKHIGNIIHANRLEGYDVKKRVFRGQVEVIHYKGAPEYTTIEKVNGVLSAPKTIAMISNDPYRRQMIIETIHPLYEKGKNAFIFCINRSHVDAIYDMLHKRYKGVYKLMGGSKEDEINATRKDARIIVITYQYGGRGLSIIRMDAIIFAAPRRNHLYQITGRITRDAYNIDSVRHVIDIVDERTFLRHQYKTRAEVYAARNWPVVSHKRCEWNDYAGYYFDEFPLVAAGKNDDD